MANLFTTLWNSHRAATISTAVGLIAIAGVGGALALGGGGGSEETTTATTTAAAAPTGPPSTPWPTYGFNNARTR